MDDYWSHCSPIMQPDSLKSAPIRAALLNYCTELAEASTIDLDRTDHFEWGCDSYDDLENNCLHFVLNCLKKSQVVPNDITLETFVQNFIAPIFT